MAAVPTGALASGALQKKKNSDESKKLPDDGRPLPKHVGVSIFNKGVVKFSACVGCFFYVAEEIHIVIIFVNFSELKKD
jgi:hypothetical protein